MTFIMDTEFTAIVIRVLPGETHKQAVRRTLANEQFPIWRPCVVQYDLLMQVVDAPVVFLNIDEVPLFDAKYKMTGEWIIRFIH